MSCKLEKKKEQRFSHFGHKFQFGSDLYNSLVAQENRTEWNSSNFDFKIFKSFINSLHFGVLLVESLAERKFDNEDDPDDDDDDESVPNDCVI